MMDNLTRDDIKALIREAVQEALVLREDVEQATTEDPIDEVADWLISILRKKGPISPTLVRIFGYYNCGYRWDELWRARTRAAEIIYTVEGPRGDLWALSAQHKDEQGASDD